MRTVVVTGGTRGIGAAIAKIFYNAGDDVSIASRTPLKSIHRLSYFPIDVTNTRSLRTFGRLVGDVDVWINAAGKADRRALHNIDEDFWYQMINVNLKSVLFGCQVAEEHIYEGGSIINVSSLSGKRGSAQNAVYCAAKFGVNGITQSLARELGPRNIRVNAVCPVLLEDQDDSENYMQQFRTNSAALDHLPTAEQVAAVCLFLAGPGAASITGQCINVDSGVFPQ